MQVTKTHIYFVPGLAANPSIFDKIRIPDTAYEIHYIEWLIPESKTESLTHYARRMSRLVAHPDSILIGVSFGGVLVQEMKKYCHPQKVIIISSIKNRSEMPARMHFSKKTKLYKLFPTKIISNIEKYEKFAFGKLLKGRVKLYKKYLSMRDARYLSWAIDRIINWERTQADNAVIHIHGTKDFIFPYKNIKSCIPVENGTHIMILTRAKEINTILQKNL